MLKHIRKLVRWKNDPGQDETVKEETSELLQTWEHVKQQVKEHKDLVYLWTKKDEIKQIAEKADGIRKKIGSRGHREHIEAHMQNLANPYMTQDEILKICEDLVALLSHIRIDKAWVGKIDEDIIKLVRDIDSLSKTEAANSSLAWLEARGFPVHEQLKHAQMLAGDIDDCKWISETAGDSVFKEGLPAIMRTESAQIYLWTNLIALVKKAGTKTNTILATTAKHVDDMSIGTKILPDLGDISHGVPEGQLETTIEAICQFVAKRYPGPEQWATIANMIKQNRLPHILAEFVLPTYTRLLKDRKVYEKLLARNVDALSSKIKDPAKLEIAYKSGLVAAAKAFPNNRAEEVLPGLVAFCRYFSKLNPEQFNAAIESIWPLIITYSERDDAKTNNAKYRIDSLLNLKGMTKNEIKAMLQILPGYPRLPEIVKSEGWTFILNLIHAGTKDMFDNPSGAHNLPLLLNTAGIQEELRPFLRYVLNKKIEIPIPALSKCTGLSNFDRLSSLWHTDEEKYEVMLSIFRLHSLYGNSYGETFRFVNLIVDDANQIEFELTRKNWPAIVNICARMGRDPTNLLPYISQFPDIEMLSRLSEILGPDMIYHLKFWTADDQKVSGMAHLAIWHNYLLSQGAEALRRIKTETPLWSLYIAKHLDENSEVKTEELSITEFARKMRDLRKRKVLGDFGIGDYVQIDGYPERIFRIGMVTEEGYGLFIADETKMYDALVPSRLKGDEALEYLEKETFIPPVQPARDEQIKHLKERCVLLPNIYIAPHLKHLKDTDDWTSIVKLRKKHVLVVHATNVFGLGPKLGNRNKDDQIIPLEFIENLIKKEGKISISCSSVSPHYRAGVCLIISPTKTRDLVFGYSIGVVLATGKIYGAYLYDAATTPVHPEYRDTAFTRLHFKRPVRIAITSSGVRSEFGNYNELLPQKWTMDGLFFTHPLTSHAKQTKRGIDHNIPDIQMEGMEEIAIKNKLKIFSIDPKTRTWIIYEYDKKNDRFLVTEGLEKEYKYAA